MRVAEVTDRDSNSSNQQANVPGSLGQALAAELGGSRKISWGGAQGWHRRRAGKEGSAAAASANLPGWRPHQDEVVEVEDHVGVTKCRGD